MVSAYIAQGGGCNLRVATQKPGQDINSSRFAAVVAANGKDEREKARRVWLNRVRTMQHKL